MEPKTAIKKYQCPFYGFSFLEKDVLMDQSANRCALIRDSFSPCQMEYYGNPPNWNECSFNKKTVEKLFGSCIILPEGFHKAIPLREWKDMVMSESK